jgi:hypothetical protein
MNAHPPSNCTGALLGAGAVLVWNDVAAEGRMPFYEWHDKEPIPGFRRGRRYAKPGHSPEWLTFYEADDVEVLVSPAYMARLNAPTPSTVEALKHFLNTARAVCRVVASVGSSSGGHVLAMRLEAAADGDAIRQYLVEDAFPRVAAMVGVLACHLFSADPSASHLRTAESRTREFDVPSWVLLVEASTEEAAVSAQRLINSPDLQRLGVSVRSDAAIYALQISRLAQPTQLS